MGSLPRQADCFQDRAVAAQLGRFLLNNLGIRLLELGRHEEGPTGIRQAVDVYRRLARQDPAAHSPVRPGSWATSSPGCGTWNGRAKSMAILREQVSVYSGLARHSHEFIPGYADALADLGHFLSALGRATGALSASTAAVAVYRQVSGDPAVAAGTADALLLFAQVEAKAQREIPEALDAVDAAITMYQRLPRPADAALRSAHHTRAHVLGLLRK
ncbi:tetratricopeptide repeat protein [Streptomyces sp. NPDC014991]|uniref:tetratricopeptide repeat protein n=1 Tax=Streptomyces sp. NPDC014991 TaxID=3364935 RepID=UPI0036F9FA70